MRMEKLRRFVDIQRQLQRAAEWQLHELRQEEHRLQAAQQEVIAALNRDDELGRWLAPALTRRLGALAAEAKAAAAAGDRQVDVVLQHAGRLKQAERLERALETEETRASDKNVLGEVLDVVIRVPQAMLR